VNVVLVVTRMASKARGARQKRLEQRNDTGTGSETA
jgi:hypothetical protein